MEYSLQGKRILFFYPFGTTIHYGQSIKLELEHRGAEVIEYDERPSQSTLMKLAIRLLKKRCPQVFINYIHSIIAKNKTCFDYIFVIRGEAFTPMVVEMLRKAYPKAKLLLYLWDILKTTNVKECLPLFDKVYSFDPVDASTYESMIFRPTFYLNCFKDIAPVQSGNIDVLFIGTLHSNRYEILSRIKKVLDNSNIVCWFYYFLPSRLVFLRDLFIGKRHPRYRNIHFTPLSLSDTIKKMIEAKCILDLKYPSQNSLSMRAFEALAAKRKYITNNAEIKKYDFYHPNNILVIDDQHPEIPIDFLNAPIKDISENIVRNYSIQGWIDFIFNDSFNV